MTPRRALGVTVLACMLAMLLPGAAWSQQSPDPGIAVTTPSEALAAVYYGAAAETKDRE